jgi:hypothetical protein
MTKTSTGFAVAGFGERLAQFAAMLPSRSKRTQPAIILRPPKQNRFSVKSLDLHRFRNNTQEFYGQGSILFTSQSQVG